MRPRERVGTALDHKEPDRPPFQATFSPEAAAALRAALDLDSARSRSRYAGVAHQLEIALHQDVLVTSVGFSNPYGRLSADGADDWGVRWRPLPQATAGGGGGRGERGEIAAHPLADAAQIGRYSPPSPDRERLYTHATHTIFGYQHDYWIVGAVTATILDTARALRGDDQLLADLARDPDLADAILEVPFRYHSAAAHRLARMGADMILLGDDLATESGLVIGTDQWRRFLKPRIAQLIGSLKAVNRDLRIAFRCSGNFGALVAELIEIGVDTIQPRHPRAIDLAGLKRAFARKLVFWGALDPELLARGRPDDVRDDVRRSSGMLGAGGGLILGPAGRVGPDVSLANIDALVREVTGERPGAIT